MRETKFIILTSLQSFNLSFPLLLHVISTAILKFPPWFSASPPWFLTIFIFPPRFPHPYADSPHLHFHPIARIPTLILCISFIPFSNSPFWFLQIACWANTLIFYFCITLDTKLLFTSSMMSSVLSSKLIYLRVPQVKNLWSVKCEQIILSGWSVT